MSVSDTLQNPVNIITQLVSTISSCLSVDLEVTEDIFKQNYSVQSRKREKQYRKVEFYSFFPCAALWSGCSERRAGRSPRTGRAALFTPRPKRACPLVSHVLAGERF